MKEREGTTHSVEKELFLALERLKLKVGFAESCTGGLIASRMVDLAGVSTVFEGSIVTYSNRAKTLLLGVPSEMIEREGPVSEAVARAMCEGLQERLDVDLAVSVTGLAGPTAGEGDPPIGRVYIGISYRKKGVHQTSCQDHLVQRPWVEVYRYDLLGDRATIRSAAANLALSSAWHCLL